MVILKALHSVQAATYLPLALLAAADKPIVERLSQQDRTRATLLIIGVIILCALMLTMVWLLGRYWKRQITKPLPPIRPQGDEWAAKPLTPTKPPVSDELR